MIATTTDKIVSYARAAAIKGWLNLSTLGTFGGRGMGQTCGAADPSQWMRMFGIDIDSRDTSDLIRTAESISTGEDRQTRSAPAAAVRKGAGTIGG